LNSGDDILVGTIRTVGRRHGGVCCVFRRPGIWTPRPGNGIVVGEQRLIIESVKASTPGRACLCLRGCVGLPALFACVGRPVFAPRTDCADGIYARADLVGCLVETSAGVVVGPVREVLFNGPQPLLIVDSDTELLIPFVKAIVTRVDCELRRIIIAPPDGLVDEHASRAR